VLDIYDACEKRMHFLILFHFFSSLYENSLTAR